ncbi:hypothetical protein IJJ37_00830 [Candidatus Saccharibacteria bacterium]|nr:hypothetical protein [Candidatus Saccharibacteria bacterium]
MYKKNMLKIVAMVLFGAFSFFASVSNVSATTIDAAKIYKLSLLQGVEKCYSEHAKDIVRKKDFVGWESIFNDLSDDAAASDVLIPTHVGNSLGSLKGSRADSDLSCKQVFNGYGSSAKGLKDYVTIPDTLSGLGYKYTNNLEAGSVNDSEYVISVDSISDASGNNGGIKIVSEGEITCNGLKTSKTPLFSSDRQYKWDISGCYGTISVVDGSTNIVSVKIDGQDAIVTSSIPNISVSDLANEIERSLTTNKKVYGWGDDISFAEAMDLRGIYDDNNIKSSIYRSIMTPVAQYGIFSEPTVSLNFGAKQVAEDGGADDLDALWAPIGSRAFAGRIMLNDIGVDESLKHYSGEIEGRKFVGYVFSPDYTYSLYYEYLREAQSELGLRINDCSAERDANAKYAYRNGPNQWCTINLGDNTEDDLKNTYVTVVDNKNTLEDGNLLYVLEWLSDNDSYSAVSDGVYANAQIDDDGNIDLNGGANTNNHGTDGNDACYSRSGAIGWIICPAVAGISQVGNFMWEEIEKDFMQIPTEFFSPDSAVSTAWGTVRNVGNIAFIALFLFVIFSQLTGVGIDNYGIKKILPRLIMVAIIMNLSFIICEILADLSNILGAGLSSTLTGFANDIPLPSNEPIAAGVGGIAITGLLGTGGVALFNLLNPLTAASAAASVGLAALGVAISMVIAILTLYLILIIREVGIVLCIVLAPVAIVCYALPNTEKLYKRWFDVFKAVLVVYPICGALVGAGQFAGRILASIPDAGTGLKIAAMLVQVLPFFLIPTLLRSSLAGLGNIGARVSNFGRNIGRRTSGAVQGTIRGSERFKDFQSYQNQQAIARRAQRVHDRLSRRTNLSAREQDRLRKADEALLAQRRRVSENATRTSGEYFAAMQAKQDLETDNETAMVNQYNDQNYQEARRVSLNDAMQKQRSRDITTLANEETRGMGLEQLRGAWSDAFDRGDVDRLDALTNVMTSRYGTSAANVIGQELSNKRGIAGNLGYQRSMQALQRTMLDNSTFSNNMKNKASDAFQMISDGGMRFDRPSNAMVYEDLGYFSEHNATSSDIKDWSTQSAATLQRAIDSGALSDEMIENILNSTDPSVRSGIQSDVSKRDVLQARLQGYRGDWNNRSLVAQAAREYRSTHLGQQEIAQQFQEQMANDLSQINEQLHRRGTGDETFGGGSGI